MARAPSWSRDKPDGPRLATDPGQTLLRLDIERERERVTKERFEWQRKAPPPLDQGPALPEGVIPFHETPRPDGLTVDFSLAGYARKRWSPLRRRWPEVHEFDERVTRLEAKQASLNAELVELQEQLVQAGAADREALARWVATQECERPLPTAPAIEQRVKELSAEREALTTAMQYTLDEKTAYVEKHRGRLVREARNASEKAVKRLHETIAAVEQARAEAVECVAAERWASDYPGETADAASLSLVKARGGRLVKAIPELRSQIVATQLTDALHQDADWLDSVLVKEREDSELEVGKDAIWESSPEGRAALDRAKQRTREAVELAHAAGRRGAGWLDQ